MEQIKISSAYQCLEIINELNKTYPNYPIGNSPNSLKLLFRGVCDNTYPLLPAVFRTDIGEKIENKKYTSFTEEKQIIKDFMAEASNYIKDIPFDNLTRWAEYAQHYGVPTRFLDWTSNPLVALYFACKDGNNIDSAIWILHPLNYRRFLTKITQASQTETSKSKLTIEETINNLLSGKEEIDYPIIYTPYYVDTRMSAQSSFFMAWGNKQQPLEILIPEKHYMLYNKNTNGVSVYGENQQQHLLLKLLINSDSKQSFIRQLDLLGINEKTLFPGLDGIGKYIERKYRFNYNEAIDAF